MSREATSKFSYLFLRRFYSALHTYADIYCGRISYSNLRMKSILFSNSEKKRLKLGDR